MITDMNGNIIEVGDIIEVDSCYEYIAYVPAIVIVIEPTRVFVNFFDHIEEIPEPGRHQLHNGGYLSFDTGYWVSRGCILLREKCKVKDQIAKDDLDNWI